MAVKAFFNKYGMGYLYLAPFMIFFAVFTVIPVVVAAVTSFTNYNMFQPAVFLGINNFKLLFLDDDVFLIALRNTFFFAVIAGPVSFFLSFFAAWIINQLKFRNAFALAFYAPTLTSGIAMSVVWLWFFSPDRYGLINNFLLNLGAIKEPLLFTIDPKFLLPVIMVISIWMGMGQGFLVFLAGLQNVSQELYEAAAVDGLKYKMQELFYITLPVLKPQLLFGAVNTTVTSIAVFDIAVSVAPIPSPEYAAHTIVTHLYDYAFIRFQMGYASSIALILFLATFLLGRVFFRVFASRDEI